MQINRKISNLLVFIISLMILLTIVTSVLGQNIKSNYDIVNNFSDDAKVIVGISEVSFSSVTLEGTLVSGNGCRCIFVILKDGVTIKSFEKQGRHDAPHFFKKTFDLQPNVNYEARAIVQNLGQGQRNVDSIQFRTNPASENVAASIRLCHIDGNNVWLQGKIEGGNDCTCEIIIKKMGKIIDNWAESGLHGSMHTFTHCFSLDSNQVYTAYAKVKNSNDEAIDLIDFTTGLEEKTPEVSVRVGRKGKDYAEVWGTLEKGINCECSLYVELDGQIIEMHTEPALHDADEDPVFFHEFKGLDSEKTYVAYAKVKNDAGEDISSVEFSPGNKAKSENLIYTSLMDLVLEFIRQKCGFKRFLY